MCGFQESSTTPATKGLVMCPQLCLPLSNRLELDGQPWIQLLQRSPTGPKRETLVAETEDMTAKDTLLQKLQENIFFEKTVTASMAANYAGPCSMVFPTWFVSQHGDKFRISVLLRSGPSTEPCRVELKVSKTHRGSPEVRLASRYWKPFADANNLAVDDSLIFCLRVMSEFDVYIFKSPTKQLKLSEAKKPDLQENVSFEITLGVTATSGRCRLTLPSAFVKEHGNMIERDVALSAPGKKGYWTVKVAIYYPGTRRNAQVMFDGRGWKAFVAANGLGVGDRLTFTLVAMSMFEVAIVRSREDHVETSESSDSS